MDSPAQIELYEKESPMACANFKARLRISWMSVVRDDIPGGPLMY